MTAVAVVCQEEASLPKNTCTKWYMEWVDSRQLFLFTFLQYTLSNLVNTPFTNMVRRHCWASTLNPIYPNLWLNLRRPQQHWLHSNYLNPPAFLISSFSGLKIRILRPPFDNILILISQIGNHKISIARGTSKIHPAWYTSTLLINQSVGNDKNR